MTPQDRIQTINDAIVNPLILLMIAVAVIYFLWGLSLFLINAEDAVKREEGKRKIVWGLIGLFVMVSVFGILKIVVNTIGAPVPPGI